MFSPGSSAQTSDPQERLTGRSTSNARKYVMLNRRSGELCGEGGPGRNDLWELETLTADLPQAHPPGYPETRLEGRQAHRLRGSARRAHGRTDERTQTRQ
ncbi:MAG: hypothetical protein M3460_11655 [Actinomycetota bacterium]|nr:hypothetical protein [Actinomycetota bacterium]